MTLLSTWFVICPVFLRSQPMPKYICASASTVEDAAREKEQCNVTKKCHPFHDVVKLEHYC